MKVNVINRYEVFDNKINNFIPTIIDDDEYNMFRSFSKNGYLITKKWVLYAYQKKYKDNTVVSHQTIREKNQLKLSNALFWIMLKRTDMRLLNGILIEHLAEKQLSVLIFKEC